MGVHYELMNQTQGDDVCLPRGARPRKVSIGSGAYPLRAEG